VSAIGALLESWECALRAERDRLYDHVEKEAANWTREGRHGDNPGVSQASFQLLTEIRAARASLALAPARAPGKRLQDDPVAIAVAGEALRVSEGRGRWSTDNLPGNDVARARSVLVAIDALKEARAKGEVPTT